ncbi:hypothetical protein CC1G_14926 [Coprinopsis cinerea okayama7|uniref:Protein-S-isoprenylcysteine O-methyltransferase n=1 Tax=Coprinopsis cinerea (strain Okayama-7 / 130 / ATCC MYA-4618 / FGSC 9003) TaxID=240176 RepID=D6RNZ1_COPC7|nr:hypothetical protein CC1G_14926 [Coprinopsis cinerea okayama7\|eukprot:XP_002910948.1 hypothetical protein CC1G_14926 [Coprinopsis cinerea okayama7\
MGPFFVFNLHIYPAHKLIQHGPYCIVRHPSYFALLFILTGACLNLLAEGSLFFSSGLLACEAGRIGVGLMIGSVAATTVGLIVGIEKEEELLEREFKDEWRGYTKRVPYRIIPFVF